LVDVALDLTERSTVGPISFKVSTPLADDAYELDFAKGTMRFRACDSEAYVLTQRSRVPLSDFLGRCGLTVLFEQDATIIPPGIFLKLDRNLPPYDLARMQVLDWSGVDLRKESQGPNRDADSIQARVIDHLQSIDNWDLLIDDDGAGEIADVVAMRLEENVLHVRLVHCKFSSEASPGARIADLYEVCGQAQKSVRWKRNLELMFRHLIRREKNRKSRYDRTGFILGDGNKLYELEDKSRFVRAQFSIVIAQPGLAKKDISPPLLELLASTEVYLHETACATFEVYCSP
jgi:hypothetical protein